jgi:O-antigen/teichoic acid export membrane protein
MYAFLAIFLFSRILPVHDFGLYVFAVAVGEFCDYTTSAWFRVGFLRVYHRGTIDSDENRPDVTAVYKITLRCLAIAIVMCWISAVALVREDWLVFGAVTTLYVIANATMQASLNTLRGEGRAGAYALIESLRPLSNLSLGLLATKFIHPTFGVAALAVFGSNALIGVTALTTIWWHRAGRKGRNRVPEIIDYAWPLLLTCALTAAMNAADRYQLQWWLGPQAVALYAAALAIGRQPIDILLNALNLGSFTELMKSYDMAGAEAGARLLSRQITMMIGLALPAATGLTLLGPDILRLLFDHRYWTGTAELIPFVSLLALFSGIKTYGYDQGFYMANRVKEQVYSMLPSVIVGVGVSAVLIRFYGLAGAAYGGCIGFGASLLLTVILVRRALPGRLPWVEVAKIVIASLLMAIVVELARIYGLHDKLGLAACVIAGIVAYGTSILALDVLGMRQRLRLDLARRWS